ncbi:MAG: c-type cytochrome [Bacteroidota bacterium]
MASTNRVSRAASPWGRVIYWLPTAGCLLSCLLLFTGCTNSASAPAYDPDHSPPLSPTQALATFQIKPGYKIQLVAAEPLVEDPVGLTFDEDGRLWVIEMRGFMTDIEGTNEDAPLGRIAVLTDTTGDGLMDTRTTFLDSLVLPRSLAVVSGGALVAEQLPLWFAEDTDGDLVADRKNLIDAEYGGSGLPEHSPNGMWRGLDNWYYNAKSTTRYKRAGDAWTQSETEFRGQWGLSHDDAGRLFYNYNWSQLHADLVPPNYLSRNPSHTPTSGIDHGLTVDRSIYPIRPNLAVNRGNIPGNLDDDGKLLEFTSASSPLVYRGTALPGFRGDVFVCEPAGNLIKRNTIAENGFTLTAEAAYEASEFLASTDERFRPVALASGPSGALYIADMYRGIIQHGAYMTPYLREVTLNRKLDTPVHMGRIWRIVPDDWQPPASTALSEASGEALVAMLSHEDGWYRDVAQRLLVEQADPATIPLLETVVIKGANPLGRQHAMWTLAGMDYKDPATFLAALKTENDLVQIAALRILEGLKKRQPGAKIAEVTTDILSSASSAVQLQLALTLGSLVKTNSSSPLLGILSQNVHEPVMRDAVMSSLHNWEMAFLEAIWQAPSWQTPDPNQSIFLEMLTTAISNRQQPEEMTQLFAKIEAAKANNNVRADILVDALAVNGPKHSDTPTMLKTRPTLVASSDATWQTRVANAMQGISWPGKQAAPVSTANEQTMDAQTQALFAAGRQQYLAGCAGCHGNNGAGLNRFAPPLASSEWVTGDPTPLIRLVLHGLEGPITVNGKNYDAPEILPVMPGHSVLDDRELSAILTYIRRAWDNNATPIDARTVSRVRHRSQGRVVPWTVDELLNAPEVLE